MTGPTATQPKANDYHIILFIIRLTVEGGMGHLRQCVCVPSMTLIQYRKKPIWFLSLFSFPPKFRLARKKSLQWKKSELKSQTEIVFVRFCTKLTQTSWLKWDNKTIFFCKLFLGFCLVWIYLMKQIYYLIRFTDWF